MNKLMKMAIVAMLIFVFETSIVWISINEGNYGRAAFAAFYAQLVLIGMNQLFSMSRERK